MIYLDSAATTPVTQPVLDAMIPYFTESFGNPSSLYSLGREAKKAINNARKQFANAINAKPEQIFFTSGATESNNLIRRNNNTISSLYEHPSMKTGFQVGDKDELEIELNKAGRRGIRDLVVCWQYVNSETGKIFPIKEYADLAHAHGYKFHSDCTSAFSKVKVDVKELNLDFASFSGHKFHAPKGVGVLYIKDPANFKSDIVGGRQEKGLKSGTENVASIVGLGKAAELYNWNKMHDYRLKWTRARLSIAIVEKMSGHICVLNSEEQAPNILCLALENIIGENMMLALDSEDIFVSTGSACHSGSNEITPVINLFNVPDNNKRGIIRISFDKSLSEDTITFVADAISRYRKQFLGL